MLNSRRRVTTLLVLVGAVLVTGTISSCLVVRKGLRQAEAVRSIQNSGGLVFWEHPGHWNRFALSSETSDRDLFIGLIWGTVKPVRVAVFSNKLKQAHEGIAALPSVRIIEMVDAHIGLDEVRALASIDHVTEIAFEQCRFKSIARHEILRILAPRAVIFNPDEYSSERSLHPSLDP